MFAIWAQRRQRLKGAENAAVTEKTGKIPMEASLGSEIGLLSDRLGAFDDFDRSTRCI
jgi:hypothetical protein